MRTRTPYAAPLSGQIIGAAVAALRLQAEALTRRTARRYFKGEPVTERAKQEIFEAIGRELLDIGVIPPSPFLEKSGLPFSRVISLVIAWHADQWDNLVGYMRSASAHVDRPDLAASSYLRLAVVDLALRASAVYALAELPTPSEDAPLWSKDKEFAERLKQVLDQCGEARPTRGQLAEAISVDEHTVDNWLDGNSMPHRASIERVAQVLADRIPQADVRSLAGQLHLRYALGAIGNLLAAHVGRETVAYLGAALTRFISRNLSGLRRFSNLPYDDAMRAQLFVLFLGARFIASPHLLKHLWRLEEDAVWRTELMAASNPWHLRLSHIAQHLGGRDEVARRMGEEYGITEEEAREMLDAALLDLPADPTRPSSESEGSIFIRLKGDAKYSARNRMIQFAQARSEGDLITALTHVRRAVELQPENADYHFQLGGTLGMTGNARDIEEGIRECWIAASLIPDWEMPRVEVGIILLNARRDHEAHEHLERMVSSSEYLSAHLALNLGVARLRVGKLGEALKSLEETLSQEPDHAMALDLAAHCAFLIGDKAKGRRLAKRAMQFGYRESYDEWVVKGKRPGLHHLA